MMPTLTGDEVRETRHQQALLIEILSADLLV